MVSILRALGETPHRIISANQRKGPAFPLEQCALSNSTSLMDADTRRRDTGPRPAQTRFNSIRTGSKDEELWIQWEMAIFQLLQ